LTNFESWGTETVKYANFVRFSFVFNHFAFKTYKTRSLGYFHYFDAFLSVFLVFWQLKYGKNDEYLHTHHLHYPTEKVKTSTSW
jgi:hypothetical protein